MRRGWYVPVGVLALMGGSVLTASVAAGASAATGPRMGPAVVRPGGLPRNLTVETGARHSTLSNTLSNWSGYVLHGGRYKSVSASWTEPKAHCKAGGGHSSAAFWVGLDGSHDGTVEQTGTVIDCHGAKARYSGVYEMFPAPSHGVGHRVRPGDKLSASVVFNGRGKFTLKLTDHTRHWTATEHRRRASAKRASAEVIIEAPGSGGERGPLADFGKVHFTGAKVNGAKIGSRHPKKLTMVDLARPLDRVSRLFHGANFSATWLHSS